jgi:hypothetical protein
MSAPRHCRRKWLLTLFPATIMLCRCRLGPRSGGVRSRRETTGVPVLARAHRGDRLQPWLAAWLTALLVLAPFAHPSLPLDLAIGPPAAPHQSVAQEGAEGEPPVAALRSALPLTLGILARPPLVETTLGPPAVKLPVLRPAADQPVLAQAGAMVLAGDPQPLFQRSAVGTARTPTGPPA